MAVTVSAVAKPSGTRPRANLAVFDVVATADGDTTATIAHGLGVVPEKVTLEPILAPAGLSLWFENVASRDATNVVLTKATTAGSGNASAQLRVYIEKPQSASR